MPVKRVVRRMLTVAAAVIIVSCAGSDGSSDGDSEPVASADAPDAPDAPDVPPPAFVTDVRAAIEAVEAELGGPQQFFEVTSNAQFTNVFVAVDDGSGAIPYAYVDGALQPPAPKQTGATGNTFAATDVDFVDDRILSGVAAGLPESGIDAISVYGDGVGATYVLAATSSAGGFLDIVVGPGGNIFSVDPV